MIQKLVLVELFMISYFPISKGTITLTEFANNPIHQRKVIKTDINSVVYVAGPR